MPWPKGRKSHNSIDRTGKHYGKLVALSDEGNGRWLCLCVCGNHSSVLSTNLAGMAKKNRGCRHCAHRIDITEERVGLLTAASCESGPVNGRHPLWVFTCACGGSIQGTVREFRAQWLRSCGCHDNAHTSWTCMMSRCYNEDDIRFNSYGARGIRVCKDWHDFARFITDMGERPKRHNLGRRHAERDYSPSNCLWEHVSKNCRDTKNDGMPIKPGLRKGAKPRST